MQVSVNSWIAGIWIFVGIFWFFSALSTKRTIRRQTRKSRLIQAGLLAAFVLVFQSKFSAEPLGWRFVADSIGSDLVGLSLTLCGAGFAVWARISLGRNWSGIVTVKEDHELVRRGPYAIVRHPIYTGALMALTGTVIARGELRGLFALGLACIALWLKVRTEEAFMQQQFGEQYREYQRHVKALIPGVL
jgi:protein-S-isoprenylcysteine O-methyltransferase Ste14